MAESRRIGVLGAGTMGNGIAQAFAVSGHDVIMVDIDSTALERGMTTIRGSLERLVAKERIAAADWDAALTRLRTDTEPGALVDRELIVEAVTEKESLKCRLLADLDRICGGDTVLASNTSSISITRLAAATGRPERVIGMHFMNPVPLMALVEVIRGHHTDEATLGLVMALVRDLGKQPVEVMDSPGFVLNRLLLPMINEAAFAVQEGLASAEDIDTAMKLGAAHPMGPLALADMIGLDTCLEIMHVLHEGFGDPKYRACPLLRRMVDAGQFGRKSGRGFYVY